MKTTKEMIEVMKAFERGEKIEVKNNHSDKWYTTSGPSWDWEYCDYRIKPKQPVLRWKWVFNRFNNWVETNEFYTDREVIRQFKNPKKLEYTATEFPE